MLIQQLSTAECLEFLSKATTGRLACARGDQPYIVPISLHFDGTAAIYSFSTVGRKIEWMRANPKVCVETDEVIDRFHWTTVVVTGTYEELDDPERDREDRQRALETLRQRPEWWLPGTAEIAGGESHASTVIYRVRINEVSGRRAARSGH